MANQSQHLLLRHRQVARLLQKDHTAEWVSLIMSKSERMELGDNIYRYDKSIFKHCDVFGQQKGLLRRSRSFKVIEVGTNRKPVCDVLLISD